MRVTGMLKLDTVRSWPDHKVGSCSFSNLRHVKGVSLMCSVVCSV